jgi:hypothetical protein
MRQPQNTCRGDATTTMNRRESAAANFAILVCDLCQLKRGPEEMPYSTTLLGALVAASVLLDVAAAFLLGDASSVLPRSLVSTTLVLALCWIALATRHLANRYMQTAGSLIACSIAFSLLILPFAWLAGPPPPEHASLTPLQTLLGWAMLAIVVWNLAVNAHILRRALDAPYAFGVVLALTWAVADWALGRALFDASG